MPQVAFVLPPRSNARMVTSAGWDRWDTVSPAVRSGNRSSRACRGGPPGAQCASRPTGPVMSSEWAVRAGLLTTEDVRRQAAGTLRTADDFERRTGRPVVLGPFCEQTFGPADYWECRCGFLRGRERAAMRCERCDTLVMPLQRRRWGLIELGRPV